MGLVGLDHGLRVDLVGIADMEGFSNGMLLYVGMLYDGMSLLSESSIATSAQPLNVSWGPQPTFDVPFSHLPQLFPERKSN